MNHSQPVVVGYADQEPCDWGFFVILDEPLQKQRKYTKYTNRQCFSNLHSIEEGLCLSDEEFELYNTFLHTTHCHENNYVKNGNLFINYGVFIIGIYILYYSIMM